jgi:hypothetical protein
MVTAIDTRGRRMSAGIYFKLLKWLNLSIRLGARGFNQRIVCNSMLVVSDKLKSVVVGGVFASNALPDLRLMFALAFTTQRSHVTLVVISFLCWNVRKA